MFMGRYDFRGDPVELSEAYDRFMAAVPGENIPFHSCLVTDQGIAILDCCPSREIFEAFSQDAGMLSAMRGAGLPEPQVTLLGEVHVARTGDTIVSG